MEFDRINTIYEFDENAISENCEEIRREAEIVFNMLEKERAERPKRNNGDTLHNKEIKNNEQFK